MTSNIFKADADISPPENLKIHPFNIRIARVNRETTRGIEPVTSLDIYSGLNRDFHDQGLFSTTVFGLVGSKQRGSLFSYINIKAAILHPFYYKKLCEIRGLHKQIMEGTRYAVWDDENKTFNPSNEKDGETGYAFFIKHFKDIVHPRTKSVTRNKNITVLEENKDNALVDRILVIPAGMRDLYTDPSDGREKQGEVNDFYRRILRVANAISFSNDLEDDLLNTARMSMQQSFLELFLFFENMLSGKTGMYNSAFMGRTVIDGTANVITAWTNHVDVIGASNHAKDYQVIYGLYQVISGEPDKTIHAMNTGWLGHVFSAPEGYAIVTNPKTHHAERVKISAREYNRYTTTDGLTSVIRRYSVNTYRAQPVMLDKYYIGLVARDKNSFIFVSDKDDIPEDMTPTSVTPITLCELIYVSGLNVWYDSASTSTRYPAVTMGSIFPALVYLKVTQKGEMLYQRGDDGKIDKSLQPAIEYPVLTGDTIAWQETQVLPPTRIKLQNADYDGDHNSSNIAVTDEAISEIKRNLLTREAWIDPDGGFMASIGYDTVEFAFANTTGEPE